MNQFRRGALVFLLACSLVIAQNNALLAQSNLPNSPATQNNQAPSSSDSEKSTVAMNYAGLDNLVTFHSSAKTPSPLTPLTIAATSMTPVLSPGNSSAPTTDGSNASQGSSTFNGRKWGLVTGFALAGTGAVLVARDEPVHQKTCIAYDACPVPGIVRVSGGLLLAVGVSIIVLKLKH